jgi:hypothetical protein
MRHFCGLRRPVTQAARDGAVEDLPEIALLGDAELRARTIEAWSHSLCCSTFTRITEMPPEGKPGTPVLRRGTQADHLRGRVSQDGGWTGAGLIAGRPLWLNAFHRDARGFRYAGRKPIASPT